MRKKTFFATAMTAVLLATSIPNPTIFSLDIVKAQEMTNKEAELEFPEKAHLLINSVEEFFQFANEVNDGNTYEGKTVRLTTDLDMSSYESISGVGTFKGTFDGGGHTIDGATVEGSVRNNLCQCTGFFHYVEGATIKNLHLTNCVVKGMKDDSSCTGGIVGIAVSSVILNCTFQGKISGENSVGGIVGSIGIKDLPATIRNCGVEESVLSGNIALGGIAGSSHDTDIENSFFRGTISGERRIIGGLVGEFSGEEHRIKNCYAVSTFGPADYVGEIVGWVYSGSSSACYYLDNGKSAVAGNNSSDNASGFNTIACIDEELKSESFIKQLNNNKVSYDSKDTWNGWLKGEKNDYPRLAKVSPVFYTKVDGVTVLKNAAYGEEGKTYRVTLKPAKGIGEIIPSVHVKDGTVIDSTYKDGVLEFVMPDEMVYMDFEIIAATPTATKAPTTQPAFEPHIAPVEQSLVLYAGGNAQKSKNYNITVSNANNYELSYSSNDTGVATVSKTGTITARQAGTATIFVKVKDKDTGKSCSFILANVTVKKAGLVFTKKVSSLKVKKTATFKVQKSGISGTVKWSVSNKKLASISSKGVLKAKKAGKVKVTASCGTKKITASVRIK